MSDAPKNMVEEYLKAITIDSLLALKYQGALRHSQVQMLVAMLLNELKENRQRGIAGRGK